MLQSDGHNRRDDRPAVGATKFREAYERFFKKLGRRPKLKKKRGKQSVWLTSELFQFTPQVDPTSDAVLGYPVGRIGRMPSRHRSILRSTAASGGSRLRRRMPRWPSLEQITTECIAEDSPTEEGIEESRGLGLMGCYAYVPLSTIDNIYIVRVLERNRCRTPERLQMVSRGLVHHHA